VLIGLIGGALDLDIDNIVDNQRFAATSTLQVSEAALGKTEGQLTKPYD
jgi:hypothetical protein